jgi:DNA repair photolyase
MGSRLIIKEKIARSVLSSSGIPGVRYCLNPYVGCSHGCVYCYATFMKRFTGHAERWGTFVDKKVNAPSLLRRELRKAGKGTVMVSSVTDPYQPLEKKEGLTRQCLLALLDYRFPVDILTKSPLVLRDVDLLGKFEELEVGITITTDDERMREVFEPGAPPINERLKALRALRRNGISTYVFIGPVLPMNPESLAEKIRPYAGSVLIDRMNYVSKTSWVYRKLGLMRWLDRDFTDEVIRRLAGNLANASVC